MVDSLGNAPSRPVAAALQAALALYESTYPAPSEFTARVPSIKAPVTGLHVMVFDDGLAPPRVAFQTTALLPELIEQDGRPSRFCSAYLRRVKAALS